MNMSESIRNISISNNGLYLAAVLNKEVIIIQLNNDSLLISFRTGGWTVGNTLAFHPNNESLAFSDMRGCIHLWTDFISFFPFTSNERNTLCMTIDQWFEEYPFLTEQQFLERKQRIKSENENTNDSDSDTNETIKRLNPIRKRMISKQQMYLVKRIHWHSHGISSLTFTSDGAYLLSGGEESVLVMTQLETLRKQFLPRLGGGITHICIASNEIHFAVCLNSNRIRIIDSINNRVMRTMDGFGICHRMQPRIQDYKQRYEYNPCHPQSIVIPSIPGSIQFWDVINDQSRGVLQLIRYPIISRTQEKYADRYTAHFMCFNYDGKWLVTVINRSTHSILAHSKCIIDDVDDQSSVIVNKSLNININEEDINMDEDIDINEEDMNMNNMHIKYQNYHKKNKIEHESEIIASHDSTLDESENKVNLVTLQIWNYINDEFILNTRIDSPHYQNSIKGIHFHPSLNRFLTYAENDEQFKIWEESFITKTMKPKKKSNSGDIQTEMSKFKNKKQSAWKSLFVGYHQKQEISDAKFTADGTIIIVCAGEYLTLWDAEHMMLLKKIQQPSIIRSLNTFEHMLLTVNYDGSNCYVWDMIKFQIYFDFGNDLKMSNFQIIDQIIIDKKYIPKQISDELFLIILKTCDIQKLLLIDVKNKAILYEWRISDEIPVQNRCLTIKRHAMKKKHRIFNKDIDVVFVTNDGPVVIPALFTQWKLALKCEMFSEKEETKNLVEEYLSKMDGKYSMFEKIFGIEHKHENEEIEKKRKQRQKQMFDLMRNKKNRKSNVVQDMFQGPPHTLPSLDSMFDQFITYFIPKNS